MALVLPLESAARNSDVAEAGVGVRPSCLSISVDGLEGFDRRPDALDPERSDVADLQRAPYAPVLRNLALVGVAAPRIAAVCSIVTLNPEARR
jgi:hypothetical protein